MDQDPEGHGSVDAGTGQRRFDPGQGGGQTWPGRGQRTQAATGCTYDYGHARRRSVENTACERAQQAWM
eukprot:10151873-Heterocapsa_arctica.AAC.1